MTPDQEAELLEKVTATNVKMNMLISEDGRGGIVPEMKVSHAILEKAVSDSREDWAFWKGWIKGGLAVISVIVLALGGLFGIVLDHILKGGGK